MPRPQPPPTFPIPNVPRSSATGYAPPPGSVYPPQTQTSDYGINPPQQPTTYATSQPPQPPQPPPAHRIRDPYSNNSHAPSSTNSYSSSTPHPSAHLPSSGLPQAPPSMPTPSVPGYGASTNFSGAPPPPMMQRAAAMPTPGQAHNPHSVPYYDVPAPVITHQPSPSGMSGGTRSVTGDWSHHGQSYSHNQDIEQRPEAAGNSSDYGRERGPPNGPTAGRPDLPCRLSRCRRMTSHTVYDSWGGFCKEKHKKEWFAKQNHHDQSYSQNEDLGQRPEATNHMSGDYLRERGPPTDPTSGRLPKCMHCDKETLRETYERFKGFCKEEHKDEWYKKHQNQNQHR